MPERVPYHHPPVPGPVPVPVQSADIVRRGKAKDNQTNAKDKARPPSIDPCRRVAWSTTCQVGAGAGGHSVADGSAPQRHTATSAPERPHSKRKSHQHSVEYPRCHNLQHRGQGRVRRGEPRGGAAWRTRRRQTALQASAPSALFTSRCDLPWRTRACTRASRMRTPCSARLARELARHLCRVRSRCAAARATSRAPGPAHVKPPRP